MKSTNAAPRPSLPFVLANLLNDDTLVMVANVSTTALGSRVHFGRPAEGEFNHISRDRSLIVPLREARAFIAARTGDAKRRGAVSDLAVLPVADVASFYALTEAIERTAWFAADDMERDANGRKTLRGVLDSLCKWVPEADRVKLDTRAHRCAWCQTAFETPRVNVAYGETPAICDDCRGVIAARRGAWEEANRAPVYCNSPLLAAAVQKKFGRGRTAPVCLLDQTMPEADDAAIAAAPKRRARKTTTNRKAATVAASAPVVEVVEAVPLEVPVIAAELSQAAVLETAASQCQECGGHVALDERGDEGLEICADCGGNMVPAAGGDDAITAPVYQRSDAPAPGVGALVARKEAELRAHGVAYAQQIGERYARRYKAIRNGDEYLAAFHVTGPLATVPAMRTAFVQAFALARRGTPPDVVVVTPEEIFTSPIDNAYRQAYIAPHERSNRHENRRNHLHPSRAPHGQAFRGRVRAARRRVRHVRDVAAAVLIRRAAPRRTRTLREHLPLAPPRRAGVVGTTSGSDPPSSPTRHPQPADHMKGTDAMKRTRDTRNTLDVTRDRYDSSARLLKLIAGHVTRKLTNTRPTLNVRHDWTDVGEAERVMNELWDIAARLYYGETGGDEQAARAMAMQAAFDMVTVPTDEPISCPDNCGHVECQTGKYDR